MLLVQPPGQCAERSLRLRPKSGLLRGLWAFTGPLVAGGDVAFGQHSAEAALRPGDTRRFSPPPHRCRGGRVAGGGIWRRFSLERVWQPGILTRRHPRGSVGTREGSSSCVPRCAVGLALPPARARRHFSGHVRQANRDLHP